MPRPQVFHDGFLIPNAADVSSPRMAEPDRIDFNTLAHGTWGVIEGCEVTVAGTQATSPGGWCVINNLLTKIKAMSVSLSSGGTQDRFDLVVAKSSGDIDKVPGLESVDPVFEDPPLDCVVLAAVFIPAGANELVNNVIDKRKFAQKKLLSKIPVNHHLVRNIGTGVPGANGDGDLFHILGNGGHNWLDDTHMYRSAEATLRIQKHLTVDSTITTKSINLSGGLVAGGAITGSNIIMGNGLPPDTGHRAAIYQNWDSGRIYVRQAQEWREIATQESVLPTGTVIMSLEPPGVMESKGWVAFGKTLTYEEKYDDLFKVAALQRYITDGPPKVMHLPDVAGYVLMGGGEGFAGGAIGVLGGNETNERSLQVKHMPKHGHDPRTIPNGSAKPNATVTRSGNHTHTISDSGEHDHDINDPGHAHHGMDLMGNPQAVICKIYGAENKLDALFNDSNHTHAVDYVEWTMKATSKITIRSAGSGHSHHPEQNGDHTHVVNITDIPDHNHVITESERGDNEPFDITPRYLTVKLYVRT